MNENLQGFCIFDKQKSTALAAAFTIRPIQRFDLNEIIILANATFGKDYLKKSDLETYLQNEHKIGLVAMKEHVIIGFALALVMEPTEISAFAFAEKSWFQEQFNKNNSIGILKTIAVNSLYRNEGIGTALTLDRIHFLKQKTASILAISWEQGKNSGNGMVLEKVGLTLKKRIPNFWSEDSIDKGYACKACGSPPCKCNALIYM